MARLDRLAARLARASARAPFRSENVPVHDLNQPTSPPSYTRAPNACSRGVQASGALHLGNYLGALVKFARLQHEIADLHLRGRPARHHRLAGAGEAGPADARDRRRLPRPPVSTRPRSPPSSPSRRCREHAELAWMFNCVARLGWLDRMTQFKEKTGKHKERS